MASMGEELSLGAVVEMLLDMRTYRMGLIQTHDQLKFSYQAIIEVSYWSLVSTGYNNAVSGC